MELYVKSMKLKVLKNGSLANDLFSAFQASAMRSFGKKGKSKKLTNAVCNIAVRKVVSKALQKRKGVGHFLASVRKVNALQISVDDFGDCFHTALYQSHTSMTRVMTMAKLAKLPFLLTNRERML